MTNRASAIEPMRSSAGDGAPRRRQKTVVRTAMDVTPKRVDWLLRGRIPFGALTVLAGQPGLGKSLLTSKIAADFSAGRLDAQGDVLMLTAEDPVAEVVVPRLKAARAKLTSVHFAELEDEYMSMPLRFPEDVERLDGIVLEHAVRLVVIDPLTAHLTARVDSFKDQSVREALAPLAALAEHRRAAIVLVAHLNKGMSTDPLQRLGGSIGLPAAARSVLLLGRDPDDPEGASGSHRVLAQAKSNFGALTQSEAFRIGSATIESWSEEITVAHMTEAGPSRYRASDLLGQTNDVEEPRVLQEAVTFLRAVLADGPRPASDVQVEADRTGLPWDTVKRAKRRAGVTTYKQRGIVNGPWLWELAQTVDVPERPAA